uniref:Caseinolytic peptidase B protein homolog n=1 Tax=Phallusia mammillata TaxID=59560 RepID=A0A6F9D8Y8_9ASCI|nr:caseinolytic peptidase B protein homolog [Phallusia mammillata]
MFAHSLKLRLALREIPLLQGFVAKLPIRRNFVPYSQNLFCISRSLTVSAQSNRWWNNSYHNKRSKSVFPWSFALLPCVSFFSVDDSPQRGDVIQNGNALLQAVTSGNISDLKSILNQIKSWDQSSKNTVLNHRHLLGWTPLMVAAISGHLEAVKLLLAAGADPNMGDNFCLKAQQNVSRMQGALIREEEFSDRLIPFSDFRGFTALHYAVLIDSKHVVEELVKHNADVSKKNHMGYSAVKYCKDKDGAIGKYLTEMEELANELRKEEEAKERALYPLEKRLKENIIGQEGAISTVASAVRRKQNGWYNEDNPLVFLFLGSSGIGKTELAKQVANYLHKDNKKGFVRLDMSEYQEKHEVAKLIGSPPGYIGHDQGGQLTKKLKAQPNAVVLFDEVDKAHPDVLTVLLQLFDEGRLTDGRGQTIQCKDAIFVMTSNLAADEIAEYGAQLRQEAKDTKRKKLLSPKTDSNNNESDTSRTVVSRQFKEKVVRPILKHHFGRDEFLGRINEFVYFLPFSEDELFLLVERELNMWAKHAKQKHGIELHWKDPEIPTILADGYNIHYGARSIKYEVDRRVVSMIAVAHERGLLKRGYKVTVQNATPLDQPQTNLSNCNLQLDIVGKDGSRLVFKDQEMFPGLTPKATKTVSQFV